MNATQSTPIKANCTFQGCDRDVRVKTLMLCTAHYRQHRAGRELMPLRGTQKHCSIEGCPKNSRSLGMCTMHYARLTRHGDPNHVEQIHGNDTERFWSKVKKSSQCWEWSGTVNDCGYGKICIDGSYQYAHRFSYELQVEKIADGMEIDHRCHNTVCVNPKHLRQVTPKQNNEHLRGATKVSRTGVRGVYWFKRDSRYMVQVGHLGKNVYVGYFDNLEEAERASIAKRIELFTHNDIDRIPA